MKKQNKQNDLISDFFKIDKLTVKQSNKKELAKLQEAVFDEKILKIANEMRAIFISDGFKKKL